MSFTGRMTRKRASALFNAAGRGLEEWAYEMEENGSRPELEAELKSAHEAMTVIYRRYLSPDAKDPKIEK